MSLLGVIERERTGATFNQDKVRTYRRRFWALVTPGTPDSHVLTNPKLPKPFDPHPDDDEALVLDINLDRVDGRRFDVEVQYDSSVEKVERPENPLDRPARIAFTSVKERVAADKDRDGKPLVNTAGDLLTGIEKNRRLWRISIQKNVPAVPRWILDAGDVVNEDAVRLRGVEFPPETLVVDDISIPEPSIENKVEFIPLVLVLLYNKRTWVETALNFGLREKAVLRDSNTGKTYEDLVPVMINGQPTSEPVPLDEDGRAYRELNELGIEVISREVDPAEIKRNERKFYLLEKRSFSDFPLS